MQFNWIDGIILLVVLYYAIEGWERGLVSLVRKTVAFLLSLWLAVRFHPIVGAFIIETFGFPPVWKDVLGYLAVSIPSEMLIDAMIKRSFFRMPLHVTQSIVNRLLGSFFSGANGLLILAFMFLMILSLPMRGTIKRDIKNSQIGSTLVFLSERYGGKIKSSLDTITQEALKFITIKPNSQERLNLDVTPESGQLTVDAVGEAQMVELVNQERVRQGLGPLRTEENLTSIARKHSRDMFERRYFSHYSPEGHDVGYRAKQDGIEYSLIGENLAYAPDVTTAHEGFMNSEGHRKNILDPAWSRIGIGVIDGDVYGKMFTQVFAN